MISPPRTVDRPDAATDEQRALCGLDPASSVFCCKCDVAISLEERREHRLLPTRPGPHARPLPEARTAPCVPAKERAGRVDGYARARA